MLYVAVNRLSLSSLQSVGIARSMRTLVLLLLLVPAARAEQYLATVGPGGATLRSGPGDKMPDTGTLPAGTTVIVHHEEGDYLAVQPPRGSLAWVPFGLVDGIDPNRPFPQNGVVFNDGRPVTLAAGRTAYGLPLSAQRTSVPDGTVITVVGPKVKAEEGGAWYPIVPPEDDFRYLTKSSVRFDAVKRAGGAYLVRSPSAVSDDRGAAVPASIGSRSEPPTSGLWVEAERAEQAGDLARAEALYLRLAGESNRPGGDPDLANRCFARVHALREKQRTGGRPIATAEGWVGPGQLRPSGLNYGGHTTFALVGSRGEVKAYVVPSPDLSLGRWVGEHLELFGRTTYPGDLRGTPLLTATRVRAEK